MEPRALKCLINLPASERNEVIAEGLEMLGRYVERLVTDANWMQKDGRFESAAILDIFAGEQAASFAILVDLARAGWSISTPRINEQIRRFNDHLSRGLYVEAYDGCPATLGEIERLLDMERRSHFLDGPSDVDWIFRNAIIDHREGPLYVDYVRHEDRCQWVTPLERNHSFRRIPKIVSLVLSLRSAGICNANALDYLVEIWRPIEIWDRNLHWQTVAKANREVLVRVFEPYGRIEQIHAQRILNDWIHPLNWLDMSMIKVSHAELQQERNDWRNEQ
ncbi:hypothetical protein [Mycobacterium sp. E2699]|uniref:hypothetical protein n=1 Tax=Mycobacterium sp. E2699 TaxID=1834137 RepID=UPI000B10A220|nr:hypothetical protein [Mycobacterium sp. E2699]